MSQPCDCLFQGPGAGSKLHSLLQQGLVHIAEGPEVEPQVHQVRSTTRGEHLTAPCEAILACGASKTFADTVPCLGRSAGNSYGPAASESRPERRAPQAPQAVPSWVWAAAGRTRPRRRPARPAAPWAARCAAGRWLPGGRPGPRRSPGLSLAARRSGADLKGSRAPPLKPRWPATPSRAGHLNIDRNIVLVLGRR